MELLFQNQASKKIFKDKDKVEIVHFIGGG